MKYFSVPADFRKETIQRYAELNSRYEDSKVIETYGQITIGNILGSGRSSDLLPKIDLQGLKEYVDFSRSLGIDFNYTLNATCLGNVEFTPDGVYEIKAFLQQIYDVGIRSLTIALPSLVDLVQSMDLDFKVKSSTLCQIINANKAMAWKNRQVERIVVDESINRDFTTLGEIREAFGEKVELIVNVVCHKNCMYRMFHYNQMTHDYRQNQEESIRTYYSHQCMFQRCDTIGTLLRLNWIRPEDLHLYTEMGIEYFKIQGRQAVLQGDPIRALEAYFQETFDGNLMELLDVFAPTNSFLPYVENKKLDGFIDPFVQKSGFCRNNCSKCGYCDSFITKAVHVQETEEIFNLANEYYDHSDPYKNLLQTVTPQKKVEEEELEIEFDF